MKVLRNGKAVESPDDSEKASRMLMEAADFFAATLAQADPRAWEALLTYRPVSEPPATKAAEAMREAAATSIEAYLRHRNAGIAPSDAAHHIRALPLPDPPPDPRDALIGTDVSDAAIANATIARLSADLAAAREALDPFAMAARVMEGTSFEDMPDNVAAYTGLCAPLYGDLRRARAVLAKLSKGA